MSYSNEHPPSHGHRSPSELGGDEHLPAHRGAGALRPEAAALPTGFRHLATGEPFNLLLAIENDNNALVAIQVANELTLRGAIPRVVNVTRSLSHPHGSAPAQSSADDILGEDFRKNRYRLLHDLISEAIGEEKDWPIESVIGDPATRILEAAASADAELIVLGINHHGLVAQAMGHNTATRIMGRASVPVLGVRPGMPNRQKLIMVATDLGPSSRQAAHIAANFLEPYGRLVLVYVNATAELADVPAESAAPMRDEEVDDAFRRITADIRANKSIDVTSLRRTGDPIEQLLAAAREVTPDLIAIGSERVDRPSRLPLESLTRALILDGRWPMLVTPPLNFKE